MAFTCGVFTNLYSGLLSHPAAEAFAGGATPIQNPANSAKRKACIRIVRFKWPILHVL